MKGKDADFKKELAEVSIDSPHPLQARYRELAADLDYIDSLLAEGVAIVRPIAGKTLAIVRETAGLV